MKDTAPLRPRRVNFAVMLLVLAAALDACAARMGSNDLLLPSPALVVVLFLGLKALQGRLWTRECFLVICALQFMGALTNLLIRPSADPVLVTQMISAVLYIAGCHMLFSRPAYDWFSQMAAKRERVLR